MKRLVPFKTKCTRKENKKSLTSKSVKQSLFLLLISATIGSNLLAQPSQTLVKTDFLKNGVTAVEGITTEKEWYKDHYAWKASFRTVTPIKPGDMDGATGVTLVRHYTALYECNGANCKKTKSELVNSEYKGIRLSPPGKSELTKIVTDKMWTEPSELLVSMQGKISLDSVKAEEPKIDWMSSKKLQFVAKLYYKERISAEETGVFETPVWVTIQREDTASPFKFSKASQEYERTIELSRIKTNVVTDPAKAAKEGAVKAPVQSAPIAGAWKPGDKVLVEENGKWYASTVLYVREKEWFIHNDAFEAKYDMWVPASRIKNK